MTSVRLAPPRRIIRNRHAYDRGACLCDHGPDREPFRKVHDDLQHDDVAVFLAAVPDSADRTGADLFNSAWSVDENLRRSTVINCLGKIHDVSSSRQYYDGSMSFYRSRCHNSVTSTLLSSILSINPSAARLSGIQFHSADRTSAGRRRSRPSARSGPVAAVTHLPGVVVPPLRRMTAGGRRSVSPVYPAVLCLPPAFSSSLQDRSHRPTAAPPAHRANQGDAATRSLETRFRRRSP